MTTDALQRFKSWLLTPSDLAEAATIGGLFLAILLTLLVAFRAVAS